MAIRLIAGFDAIEDPIALQSFGRKVQEFVVAELAVV
jgi:hypothetical protein